MDINKEIQMSSLTDVHKENKELKEVLKGFLKEIKVRIK